MALAPAANAGSVNLTFPVGAGDDVEVLRGSNGKVAGIVPKTAVKSSTGGSAEAKAKNHLNNYASTLGVSAKDFKVKRVKAVAGGDTVRMQQYKNGKEVLGGEVIAALDPEGSLQALVGEGVTGKVESLTGAVSLGKAKESARKFIAKLEKASPAAFSVTYNGEKVLDKSIFGTPGAVSVGRLVQEFKVEKGLESFLVWTSQKTGAVLLHESQLQEGLSRHVCDAGNKDTGTADKAACDNKAQKYARSDGQGPTGQADVDAIYDQLLQTAQWYANYANLDVTELTAKKESDGKALRATVRVCAEQEIPDCPMKNAFYSGATQQLYFGDSYRALDITAHELTHAVTDQTSNLRYIFQSGAINESMSDVFAEIIDTAIKKGKNNWLHGDENPGSDNYRDMANPGKSTGYPQPATVDDSNWFTDKDWIDNGGVHINSGVGNRAGYLITMGEGDIRGLGPAKAFKLYWTAQNLLPSGADYKDLFNVLQVSCEKNIGRTGSFVTKDDCAQVSKAVRNTRMYADPKGDQAPVNPPYCDGGQSVKRAFYEGWETVDGTTFTTNEGAGLTVAQLKEDYVNQGRDAGVVIAWADHPNSVFEQKSGVKVPSGAQLRVDYATEFGTQPGDQGSRAGLQYNDGSGWKNAGDLKNTNGEVWTGFSGGWSGAKWDLSSLAGKTVKFRFLVQGAPQDGGNSYLWVDGFKVYTCS